MSRKAFVAMLEKVDLRMGFVGHHPQSFVGRFYEMIEPLDKEVAKLRAEVRGLHSRLAIETTVARGKIAGLRSAETDKLGKELDAALTANEQLHDRLVLALDGGRPPKELLSTVAALEPFAAVLPWLEELLKTVAKKHPDAQPSYKDPNVPVLGCPPTAVTMQHIRAAARTLAWVNEHRRARGLAKSGKGE